MSKQANEHWKKDSSQTGNRVGSVNRHSDLQHHEKKTPDPIALERCSLDQATESHYMKHRQNARHFMNFQRSELDVKRRIHVWCLMWLHNSLNYLVNSCMTSYPFKSWATNQTPCLRSESNKNEPTVLKHVWMWFGDGLHPMAAACIQHFERSNHPSKLQQTDLNGEGHWCHWCRIQKPLWYFTFLYFQHH